MPPSTKYNSHSLALLRASFPRLSVRAIVWTFKNQHECSFTPSFNTLRDINEVLPNDIQGENDHVRALVLEVAPFLASVGKIVLKHKRGDESDRLPRKHLLDHELSREMSLIPDFEDLKENLLPSRGQPKEPEPDDEEDRDNGETRECGCCMDDFLATEMVHCGSNDGTLHPNCHFFCGSCLQRHVSEQLFGKNQALVQCMSMEGCTNTFGEDTFDSVLTPRTKKNFDIRRTLHELQKAGIEVCQCPKCDEQRVNEEHLGVFDCPSCRFKSCVECMKKSHQGQTCEEAAEQEEARCSARNKAENAITAAVVRQCPSCKVPFQKGGKSECNKIICTCGTMSCYLCRQEIKLERPYEHFCQTPHCTHATCGKCILFTNTEEDDRQARRQAGLAEVQKAAASGDEKDIGTLLSPEREQGQAAAVQQQRAATDHGVAGYPPQQQHFHGRQAGGQHGVAGFDLQQWQQQLQQQQAEWEQQLEQQRRQAFQEGHEQRRRRHQQRLQRHRQRFEESEERRRQTFEQNQANEQRMQQTYELYRQRYEFRPEQQRQAFEHERQQRRQAFEQEQHDRNQAFEQEQQQRQEAEQRRRLYQQCRQL